MKMSELFPSRFLKAEEFGAEERRTLTIKSVELEELGQNTKKETKPVVYFREGEKGLVLNKTNGAVIAELYGDDSDEWTGKKITLITLDVDSFGDVVRAIRVSKTVSASTVPAKTRESKIVELTTLRQQIHELGGAMPAKQTLKFDTEPELDAVLIEHRALNEKAILAKAV